MDSVRVEWGDGEVSDVTVADPPAPWELTEDHVYAAAGTYTVTITGALNGRKTMFVTVGGADPVGFGVGEYGTGTYGR